MGKTLAHGTEGVLHHSRPHRVVVGSKAAIAVALGKELEEEEGVINISEGGVGAQAEAEGGPDGSGAVL